MSDCPRREEIRSLVAGSLDPSAAEALLEHIAGCERCLAEADGRWAQSPALRAFPNLEADRQASVERSLMARIGRSDLSGQSLLLATLGLLKVVLGLLEPVFSFFDRPAEATPTETPTDADHQGS